jgi:cytochrome P450
VALIFYYLAANPDVQERAREEADRVVQDRLAGDDDKTLNGEDASELTYIDQVRQRDFCKNILFDETF